MIITLEQFIEQLKLLPLHYVLEWNIEAFAEKGLIRFNIDNKWFEEEYNRGYEDGKQDALDNEHGRV